MNKGIDLEQHLNPQQLEAAERDPSSAAIPRAQALRMRHVDSEAEVHLCVSLPGRIIQMHDTVWVADYGGGPQINAALDFKPFSIYVGCGMEQFVTKVPDHGPRISLGQYQSREEAARVRDFYVVHSGLDERLSYPDFDYETWIPPRTTSGEYNEEVAKILREKLLQELTVC